MKILANNWYMQSSEQLNVYGEEISRQSFSTESMYPVTIPGTVVGGLVENGVYEDPYYGTNMKNIPGYKHGKKTHFAFHRMPKESPFRKAWWFRNEFTLDSSWDDHFIQFHFKGLNYKGDIWLNGRRIAGVEHIHGTYRRYTIDGTHFIKRNGTNVLAIELYSQSPDDLGITFIDWSPVPPDDSMGIWQPISITKTKAFRLSNPHIVAIPSLPDLKTASIRYTVTVHNNTKEIQQGKVSFTIENILCEKEITVDPLEEKKVSFTPEEFPQLNIDNPRIWWPYQMGTPELYEAKTSIQQENIISDTTDMTFGIRHINTTLNEHGACQFSINGKVILIRGTAWSPDLLLRQSNRRDEIDLAMLKSMNMNTIRLEGKLATDYFWDVCNREGILVLAGWPCCTHWEQWDRWKPEDLETSCQSLISQLLRLRNHPSFALWMYGSDFPPPPHIEKKYLAIMQEYAPEIPYLSSASAMESTITGKTGVKMSGPYGYVPPVYWYDETMPGVAHSFNTEAGPDMSIPLISSLQKFIPKEELYRGSPSWNHHAGLASFLDTEVVNNAVDKRYGTSNTLKEFVRKAQISAYEAWRAMFEAYGYFYPKGTGIIGWMHNGHWPSVLWQLYDYYDQPTGGFFGAQKACEPLHIQYAYHNNEVSVLNYSDHSYTDVTASITLYDINTKELYKINQKLDLTNNSSHSLGTIEDSNLSSQDLSFLHLTLTSKNGLQLSRNVYWLSSQKDTLMEKSTKETWYYRPQTTYASFEKLFSLSNPDLTLQVSYKNERIIQIELENSTNSIAFFKRLDIVNKKGESITPVMWSDNCITLLPQEKYSVTAKIWEDEIEELTALTVVQI